MSSVAVVERPNRSVIPNDPRRLAKSVDMRSPDGRLFADCFDNASIEFPDAEPLKVREIALVDDDGAASLHDDLSNATAGCLVGLASGKAPMVINPALLAGVRNRARYVLMGRHLGFGR
jgi:hypothetical protein